MAARAAPLLGPRRQDSVRPQAAPSARLLMQLDECSRIKAAFVRAGMPCPTAAIERGILFPEDRPQVLCLTALPVSHAVPPVVKQSKGKKGRGGGKGKKKK